MNILLYILIILVSLNIIERLYSSINRKSNLRLSIEQIKHFDKYLTVLDYHMQKAYDVIYKDSVLVYSIEGLKPKEEDVDGIMRKFCSLTFKMLGPSLKQELMVLYGDEETLLFNIVDYFNGRYEEDEIRNGALNNIVETKMENKG